MDRRQFLKRSAAATAVLPFFSFACGDVDTLLPSYTYSGPVGPVSTFSHGVASGDPSAEGVILWTRITPRDLGPVEVFWEVARDPDFFDRVAADHAVAAQFRDWTVKIDLTGLKPGEVYYYRFFALGRQSQVGRTRTLPVGSLEDLSLAVVSCSNIARGFFRAYRAIADRDDIFGVLHLGDYIYEYGGNQGEVPERDPDPPYDIVSLNDYRTRYAQYRRDKNLQKVHQQHPFITVWDDHESANNSWYGGAENHYPSQGPWEARKTAAIRAYLEWLPIRESESGKIWRSFAFGDLVDLMMLDTRLWGREEPPGFGISGDIARAERQLLGDDQEAWLLESLQNSTSHWRLIGQQVVMAQLRISYEPEVFLNGDQWDGYASARDRLYAAIQENDVGNLVVVTGDIHSSWANELSVEPNDPAIYDPETGRGAIACEFVTPAISSRGLAQLSAQLLNLLQSVNPHVKFLEATKNGYVNVEFSRTEVRAHFWHLDDVLDPVSPIQKVASFRVLSGESKITPLES